MDPPNVYIEREPFVSMILSSVETFHRECFGYVLGYKPTRRRNSFIITNVVAVQLAKKRKNMEIEQSKLSCKHMYACFDGYPSIYPLIGDFHSHPEWGRHQRLCEFSDGDAKDMLRVQKRFGTNSLIGVVIKISRLKKERILWHPAEDGKGGIKGSLGKYKFHINVCRMVKDSKNKDIPEFLIINADSAMKSLNRALGYIT